MMESNLRLLGDQVVTSKFSWDGLGQQIITTIVFLTIGLICFWFSDWFIERAMPLSVRKALEEDKNTALAIVIGSAIIGLSIIIAAAIR